ncbi:MAG: hypothetical protein EHM61_02800 [Acidobacteria bacterium]|nr:MAG: hypothetical protein EHM61_02800 [Acidobacteriota bacterium]
MTGRIEILAAVNKPGLITSNSGACRFQYIYRLPLGRLDGLAKGRLVTFELEKGSPEVAVGVCPKELGETSPGDPPLFPREIRYGGFEQTDNIRSYKFQAWQSGEENQVAVVTVDLALFRRHGITLQEGPALCLRLVQTELRHPSASEPEIWKRALTDKEMADHAALRPTSTRKRN